MHSTLTHVAVGIVFDQANKVLIALRPDDKQEGGFWEFPGGKIEPGETVEEALKRELLEEVGITLQQASFLIQHEYSYQNRRVALDVWTIKQFSGKAYGKEGQRIAWVTLEELKKLPVLSANHTIILAIESQEVAVAL
jgi:8-oxo-dGTP diphosphatase